MPSKFLDASSVCSYKRQQLSFKRYFKSSSFLSMNLCFSWSFYECFHSHCLQNLQFLSFGWLMQRTATSCSSVRLLFRIVAGPLIALLWSVGFANSHRLHLCPGLLMIMSVCLHTTSFCSLFLKFCATISVLIC